MHNFHLTLYMQMTSWSFAKGNSSCIESLRHLSTTYALAFGQVIKYANKSIIYLSTISHSRFAQIVNLIGFNLGTFPFKSLGMSILKDEMTP